MVTLWRYQKWRHCSGIDSLKSKYSQKAIELKKLVQDSLWNDSASFFQVRKPDGQFCRRPRGIRVSFPGILTCPMINRLTPNNGTS
jgi:hypothetical protein